MEPGLLGFTTLLIGLTAGRVPVELMVAHPVAQVRLAVDDRAVAVLGAPPWRAEIDFGSAPAPHRLEAVGLDGGGAEIARAVQWVNLPRPEAELDLVLERDETGRAIAARLAWTSARPVAPSAVRAVLDGAPVSEASSERIVLPASASEGSHFLRVEVEFPGGKSAAKELVFGGVFSEASSTALTAIPVEVAHGRETVGADAVGASLVTAATLRIAAVEKGSARIVVVVDSGAIEPLRKAAQIGVRRRRVSLTAGGAWGDIVSACAWVAEPLRSGDDDVLVCDPRPDQVVRNASNAWLFTVRARSRTRAQDFLGVLLRTDLERGATAKQALTNAVGTAGLMAAAGGHRRAVVLILGESNPESGDLGAANARGFLERIDVPLRVWSPVAALAARDLPAWGRVENVSTCRLLARAKEALVESLDRQRVVWVEGQHLPHEVVVASPRLVRAR